MVMITPAISHENFGEFFSPENLKRFKVLNSTYVMLTADTHKSQGQPKEGVRKIQESQNGHFKEHGYLLIC